MENDNPPVCFTDIEVMANFMDEFAPDGTDDAQADEYKFILAYIAWWPTAEMDWLIPGRARIIGMRPALQKEVMLVTHVIRFKIQLH